MKISEFELKVLGRLTQKNEGKLKYQPFYEELLRMALRGMNIGGWDNVENSGELPALRYVRKNLVNAKEPLTIFDVGANLGKYANLIAKMFSQRKKEIYSFEPSKKTYAQLKKNCSNNKDVRFLNFGLSDKEEKVKLYLDKETSGMASIYKRRLDYMNIYLNIEEEIQLKTLDGFCANNKIKKIDLLKMDVEGSELKVLEGAKNMLNERSIKFIQFEFGGCNIDSRTYLRDFYYALKDNYIIYRIVSDGLYEIKQYKEMYELFITTNFLAELRKK